MKAEMTGNIVKEQNNRESSRDLGDQSHVMSWSKSPAAAAAKSLQSCPTLCDHRDSSLPGVPIPGILQARTLGWVAISFSNAWKWKVKVKSLTSHLRVVSDSWMCGRKECGQNRVSEGEEGGKIKECQLFLWPQSLPISCKVSEERIRSTEIKKKCVLISWLSRKRRGTSW